MRAVTTSAFELPERLAAKADETLIAADERHFASIAAALEQAVTDLTDQLDAARRTPGGLGRQAMDRDTEIHRLTTRLRALRRYGLDLCLGRMVPTAAPHPSDEGPEHAQRSGGGEWAEPGQRGTDGRDDVGGESARSGQRGDGGHGGTSGASSERAERGQSGTSSPDGRSGQRGTDGRDGTGSGDGRRGDGADTTANGVSGDGGASASGDASYVGRLGLTGPNGRRLLLDWRSPAAEPFFAATHARPMGLASRRRYRWAGGRVVDYWDEVFTGEGLAAHAALDDQSAFIASLGDSRSERMRDVLATIQSDQDAIIRADARGPLVVDGGPGTGKTVVALHRSAYLLYADPRLAGDRRGGVLFVGPHQPYLAYVADVLPSLGEYGVRVCTLRDLVPEGAGAGPEPDPEAARLKASADMERAVEAAVRFYEEPPTEALDVSTDWADLRVRPADWAEAFAAPEPGTPHNEARGQIWEELAAILYDRLGGAEALDVGEDAFRRALRRDEELADTLHRAWPLIEPTDLVGDLWTVPAYLRLCAPWLGAEQRRALRRTDPAAWTVADLPLLDAARHRLGDTGAERRARRREAAVAAQRARMEDVIDTVLAADDDGEGAVTMLRGADLRSSLVDEAALPAADPDRLAGPFTHIVVDEAQELTDAEWQMLLRRCPSRSLTIVGDRAQARRGFTETWAERLARVGLDRVATATLSINYRTPQEVMDAAEPVIRAVLPDANVPTSVRSSGIPVSYGRLADLPRVLDTWLTTHPEGTACVITPDPTSTPLRDPHPRVRCLTPELTKGLEFDLVILLSPDSFPPDITGAVDRYVAMTRATACLAVLTK